MSNRQVRRRSSIVYKRHRSHFDSDYLRENADNIAGLLSNALKHDDPALSQPFKQALHLLVESVAKTKGTSLSQASRKHNIPHKSLSNYVAKELIPVLYRDRGTIYIANETAEEVSRDYQEAKEMGIPPARLLRQRREKYFPEEASTSESLRKAIHWTYYWERLIGDTYRLSLSGL
jgi:DNA-binding phage protein